MRWAGLCGVALLMMLAGAAPHAPAVAQGEDLVATVQAMQTEIAALATDVAELREERAAQAQDAPQETPVTPTAPSTSTPPSTGAFDGTPVTESQGAVLLYYHFRDTDFGGAIILGELRNSTDDNLDAPTLNVTFYDDENRIVDTAEADALISVLKPGETMPIQGGTDLEPGQWVREEIALQGGGPMDNTDAIFYAEGLELREVNEVEKTGDSLRVLGEVHNGGDSPATLVQVQALVYDEDGRFTARLNTFTDMDSIPVGGSAPFEIDGRVDAGRGWTYRLIVGGWPTD